MVLAATTLLEFSMDIHVLHIRHYLRVSQFCQIHFDAGATALRFYRAVLVPFFCHKATAGLRYLHPLHSNVLSGAYAEVALVYPVRHLRSLPRIAV